MTTDIARKTLPAKADSALKLFISYSRRDRDIAEQMVASLTDAGFEVTIDTRDLPFGEEWQEELRGFIQDCDSVIWLVSPDSVGSYWVNWELGEVQRAGKRMIPIVARETQPEALPKALGKIHLLPPSGEFDTATHMKPLVEALETDRAWVKDHSRLGVLARQWEAGGKGTDRLLRGKALADAEAWRMRQPAKAPPPDPLILDLLVASEQGAKRRQRQWIGGLAASVVLFAGIAAYAVIQQGIAVENEKEALAQAKIANERAARLSIPAAQALREDGFNVQALLLLLQAAKTFDDANAPAAMRIEFERVLERANHEVLRTYVPADVSLSVEDGRPVLDGPAGEIPDALNAILNNVTAMPPGKDYDCAQILTKPAYAGARRTEEQLKHYWPGDKDRCSQKRLHVVLERQFVGPDQLDSEIFMFDLTSPRFEMLAYLNGAQLDFDWWANWHGFQFAYAEDRVIHVKASKNTSPYAEARFAQSAEPGKLLFLGPNRLIALSPIGPDPTDAEKLSRMAVVYDLKPKPLFVEPLESKDALAAREPSTGKDSPFLNTKVCAGDIDGFLKQTCKTVSSDGLWTLAERSTPNGIKIDLVKTSAPDAPVFSYEQGRGLHEHLGTAIFLGPGPDLLIIDNTADDRVMRVSPPDRPGGAWTMREVYRHPAFIAAIKVDATGDRLTIYTSSTEKAGATIVSISAKQVWRNVVGTAAEIFVGELKERDAAVVSFFDPDMPGATRLAHRFPALSELAELGIKALPEHCQPAEPQNWRDSPCWPD